jgi:2-polyprenyl-3-methyl-5-hydroxy-6-metoxy-1,4-benzoquinol methylase
MSIDHDKLHELLAKAITDFGGTFHAALVVMGDKLGLYKALAESGPLSPAELAEKTDTSERYVREWLSCQAAGGYITYDPDSKKFSLSEEQAFMLADETSPAFVPGAFQVAVSSIRSHPEIEERFRNGGGFGWHEHQNGLFEGTERFFRPNYMANLISSWIPALNGVEEKLREGALVADVGCGHGASTILMAKSYPESKFIGYDYHEPSIERARKAALESGLNGNISFEVAASKDYPGSNYDFVAFFDCLHDMGDPAGASAHVLKSLSKDGTWMIVEPFANDNLEDNLNPIGRAYYGASTMICTPASLAQEVGAALGAQAGESRLRDVVMKGGFKQFRRATETPFNIVFEAKP